MCCLHRTVNHLLQTSAPHTPPRKNLSRTKLQAWPQCKDNWQASSSSAWPLANSPHPMSMPLCSNNTHPPVAATNTMVEVVSAVAMVAAVSRNNQTCLLATAQACSHPLLPLPPTSITRIGTTAILMAAISTMSTPVQRVGTQDQHTTQSEPHQHHWWIGCQNAKDHFTLGIRTHFSTQSSPPAVAAPAATSNSRHYLAAHNPSCAVWWNATGRQHLMSAYYHGHSSLSARPGQDELRRPKPFGCRARANYADDAVKPTANRDAQDGALLCPQLELLTCRGGTR
jgi:hypothetical protein